MANPKKLTPMMRQYFRIKARHRDVILFFQLGDFYETFYEDAELCARELDLVLTRREGAPMAGVPLKKADVYVHRLLKKGYKVALCDQLQDPSEAKGVVERDVVRIVTPGTVLEDDALEPGKGNYLVAVCPDEKRGRGWGRVGLAYADVSTGEFRATELPSPEEARQELARLRPAELVLPEGFGDIDRLLAEPERRPALTARDRGEFSADVLKERFGLLSLEGLGLTELAAQAAGGLLGYLQETQKEGLQHVSPPTAYAVSEFLQLDPFTQRNLELVQELRTGGEGNTLLSVLDETVTGMGERLLRKWLLTPLLDREEIERRLDAVELLYEQELARRELRDLLARVYDVERLAGKLGTRRATPRDLLSLQQSLRHLPELKRRLQALLSLPEGKAPERLRALLSRLQALRLEEVAQELQALREDAPLTLKEGNIFREGFLPELDALKAQEREYKQKILDLEQRERERTNIPSLKVGYNTVFGYYIEVTKTHTKRVPSDYIRKQTLTQAERYITPELKQYEEKILSAQERAQRLEYEFFCRLRDRVAARVDDVKGLAQALAELDVYAALAEAAKKRGYTRPEFTDRHEIHIEEGRHPVIEAIQKDPPFVPNDLKLAEDETLVVLTGPNMSGKSTFLRQSALICLMAQMGSFVPARRAVLPIVDRIFTRVGASDMLAFGYSTFMVEMIETATILNRATERSLVILDEMGRGTSTFDGVAIAWAVAEYLVRKVRAKTLFATHYHELTLLAEKLPGVVNLHVLVAEHGDEVIFLHRVERGAAEGSYGVHVAKLAGLPQEVIERASEILHKILQGNPLEAIEGKKPIKPRVIVQPALFGGEPHPVLEELKKVDVEKLTPIEALNLLAKLKEKL